MKKLHLFLSLFLALAFLFGAKAQTATGSEVMIQGFNWESHKNTSGWYNVVAGKAADLKASRIDAIWMPPPHDAAASEGYLPRQLYNLNSKYGTQTQLTSMINTLHANNVKVLADIVINHRVGTANWADFTNPTWGCWAVTGNDEWTGRCGANDSGDGYGAARDLDHSNVTVQNDIKAWMNWLKNTIKFDGWRYDYVKGYWGGYNKIYNQATTPYFSVGELWTDLNPDNPDPHRQQLADWVNATGQTSTAFDFTTKGILQQAVQGQLWRLSRNGQAPGLIGWWGGKAVTFLDNHDTGSTQAHWPFPGDKVMQGYAYILTHPGTPMVFWDHFYDWGLASQIKALINIRKDNGLTSTSTIAIQAASANLYAAIIDGKVAMKIGSDNWSPGTGWTLRTSGTNYAVWTKNTTTTPTGFTVYFKPVGYTNPNIHFWNPTPAGSIANTTWPGPKMTVQANGWYSYTFPNSTCVNLIFSNNGASQSADLSRCGNGWYKGGVWYTSQTAAGGREEEAAQQVQRTEVSVYPNTFADKTTVAFSLAENERVVLKVFNIFGAEVTTLTDQFYQAGTHQVEFKPEGLAAGTYIYRLYTSKENISGRMILTR